MIFLMVLTILFLGQYPFKYISSIIFIGIILASTFILFAKNSKKYVTIKTNESIVDVIQLQGVEH